MSISLASLSRVRANRPPVIVVHGGPGIGKTTFAASAPGAVFVRTEDGLGHIEADAFPLAQSFVDVMDALRALYAEQNAFRWVVLDSLSALEPLSGAKRKGRAAVRDMLPNGCGTYKVRDAQGRVVAGGERSVRTDYKWAD